MFKGSFSNWVFSVKHLFVLILRVFNVCLLIIYLFSQIPCSILLRRFSTITRYHSVAFSIVRFPYCYPNTYMCKYHTVPCTYSDSVYADPATLNK